MDFDEVFGYIGEFGIYQIILYLLLGIASFYPGYQSIAMTFVAGIPDHWCKVDRLQNFSYDQQKHIAIPFDESGDYKSCYYYDHDYENYTDDELAQWDRYDHNDTDTLKCDQWVYDQSELYSTLAADWDLVCDDSYKKSLLSALYLAGILFGAPISGILGDRFGRFPTLMIGTLFHFIFATAGVFAPEYISFSIFRFLMSVFHTIAYLTAFVIVMEVIGPRYRTVAGIFFQIFFSIGFMTLPCIAYFVRDYTYILIIMAAPVACSLPFFWLVPESPRWLLANNEEEKALKVVHKIAEINGKEFPKDASLTMSTASGSQGIYGDLLRHPLLRKELFIMYLAWFTNSLVYYGLSLNTGTLVGSVYLNTFISGAVEIPANLICIWALYVIGRRLTLSIGFIVGGVAAYLCIPFIENEDLGWLSTMFSMIGKAAITLTFSTVYLYTAELFPTPVRHLAVGSASMIAKISGLISPFMGEPLMSIWVPLPSVIFGSLSVASGLCSFLLPETLGKPLPDTFKDAEEIGRSKPGDIKKEEWDIGSDNNAFESGENSITKM